MAYRFEKTIAGTDIVMDGMENGIADSPYEGIGDMRNINIISVPKEGSVNFATSALIIPPVFNAGLFVVTDTTDVFEVLDATGFYNGMAVTFNTINTATGFSTGRVYWIGALNLPAKQFKLYKSPALDAGTNPSLVNVTASGSGTMSTYTLTSPLTKTIGYSTGFQGANSVFILDDSGKVWWVNNLGGVLTNTLVYLGNDTLTGTTGRAIVAFQFYLLVFRTSTIDYLQISDIQEGIDLDSGSGWHYSWESVSSVFQNPRPVLAGTDDGLYYGNSGRLGSILVNAGQTFAPSNAATYTKSLTALNLPDTDEAVSLAELGQNLLVGGLLNVIYPWDRISTSFYYPLILSENLTTKMVSSNSNTYIFAGNRGRIYITNGSNVELYKKVPDSITNSTDPYFVWEDAVYWKNQLYFSFTANTNAGVSIPTTSGVWAIDVTTNSFRYSNELSYGALTGTTPVIVQNVLSNTPGGAGLYMGWTNSGVSGVDTTTAIPYTGGQAYIDFDIIPVGEFLTKKTFQNADWKLATPLVSGESVQLLYRTDITSAYTSIGITTTAGLLSDQPYPVNFETSQWVQLRIVLTSTASNPSLVRLREVRIR